MTNSGARRSALRPSPLTLMVLVLLALALPAPHTWLLIPFATGTGLLIALAGGLEQAWMRILSAVLLAACVLAAVLIGSAALFSWSFAPLVFVHLPAAVAAWMRRRPPSRIFWPMKTSSWRRSPHRPS